MAIVAVIGASADQTKFGNKALRAFRHHGDTVVPINPNAKTIEGEHVYASVLDYPGPIDEATVYVPPHVGIRVIEEIAKKGIKTVWLNPRALGLTTRVACSMLGIGERPGDY